VVTAVDEAGLALNRTFKFMLAVCQGKASLLHVCMCVRACMCVCVCVRVRVCLFLTLTALSCNVHSPDTGGSGS
jgi:hypothetical protein